MKKALTVFLMVLMFSNLTMAYQNESIGFNECKFYYVPQVSGNATHYVEVRVCGPGFPAINQKVTLSKETPLVVFPNYNLSVDVDQEVYTEALKFEAEFNTLSDSYTDLKADFDKLKVDFDAEVKERKESDLTLNDIANGKASTDEIEKLTGQFKEYESELWKENGSSGISPYLGLIGLCAIGGLFYLINSGKIGGSKTGYHFQHDPFTSDDGVSRKIAEQNKKLSGAAKKK